MSPAHSHTVGAATTFYCQDDDDDDICPVCDGECTCNNRPRAIPQPVPLNQCSLQLAGSSSSSTISSIPHATPKHHPPPLKIKLTVPPNLLGNKKHASTSKRSKNDQETTFASVRAGEASYSPTPSSTQSYLPPGRRGRPTKTLISAREAAKAQAVARLQSPSPRLSHFSPSFNPRNVGSNKRKKSGPPPQKRGLKVNPTSRKRPLKRKRRAISDDGDDESSNLTDADYDCDDDGDESVKFPIFISASALSSMESDNSSCASDSSDSEPPSFESDSDLEKEEESFIVSQVHEKARLRRELLGDNGRRSHDSQGDWVIRSRKKSVGPSDNDMAVDSDDTEDEDEDDDEEEIDEDDEETDGRAIGAGYAGLVTAWTDDDESSFDADVFFANLTDSDTNSDSSCSRHDEDGEDGDHSDMETASHSDTAELMSQRQELENLQLDVTQGWDGQMVFTNGLSDGRGILDIDFEVKASQFMAESSPLPTQDSDVDMSPSSVGASDEDGYEEDDNEAQGDTTDEELVGEDDLPNERAMRMFSLPFNVSAINPLSTVSPIVSPAPHRRIPSDRRGLESPKPEDILAGKAFWDSDNHEEEGRGESRSQASGDVRGPRTGLFVPVQETRKAIIDGTSEVPSPHPKFSRRRGRSTNTRINTVEQMLRRHLLNNARSTPTFTTASELLSPLQLLSSDNDFGSPSPSMSLPLLSEETEALAESINLDDVLEASFLVPDSSEASDNSLTKRTNSSAAEGDRLSSGKHLQSLNRWDLISVGAFRQTRENGGWSSDNHTHTPHSSVDYNSILKASPLSAIMWPNGKEKGRRRRNLSEPMPISPVILPVRDGDRTPTGSGSQQQNGFNQNFNKHAQHSQKESKRERKLKKKNWGPVHHQHSHHHHWHQHQHHPNSKTRGSAASQRSFLSAVPPFSL